MSQGIMSDVGRFDLAQTRGSSTDRPGARIAGPLLAAIGRAWRRHRDRFALATLDDRALADIGIGPGGIEHAVRYGRDADAGRHREIGRRRAAPTRPGW